MIFNDEFQESKRFELKVPQIQFFLRVPDIPVATQRQVLTVQTVQPTSRSRCSSWMVVDVLVVVRRQVPEMVQTVQKTVDSAVAVLSWVWSISWTRLLLCPLLCNDRCVVESVQEIVEVPQLQCFDKLVDILVVVVQTVQPVEIPQVQFLDAGHRQGVDVELSAPTVDAGSFLPGVLSPEFSACACRDVVSYLVVLLVLVWPGARPR